MGYYFYQSSADFFYLYKSNENGEKKECLAQQVPREIYMINDQVFFTNMSDNQTLYRINTDGRFLYIELMDESKEEKTFCTIVMDCGGKGELWYWIHIKTGEAGFFEDMLPFENINALQEDFITMCQGATEQSRFYMSRDLVYEGTKRDEEGNLIKTQQMSGRMNPVETGNIFMLMQTQIM